MVSKTSVCRCCLSDVDLQPELYEFSSEVSVDEEVTVRPKNFVKISECWRNVIFPNTEFDDEFEDVSRICSQCLGDLKFCFLFRKKCLDSAVTYNEYEDGNKNGMNQNCNFTGCFHDFRSF